ncbi:Na+/H+ antiporter NhaA [Ochrovirga pacifica]|uniref:Na+/H+ antiporter NhaA n=1 Tax=Ochrovirga pacifica TaxID=1042376 RepID=UPI0002558E43|nr:Na+/H+ antiporter NhaA [Ochrovirga pacifica]
MKNNKLYKEFFQSEKTGGLLLIVCTLISLIISNSDLGEMYNELWQMNIGKLSVTQWINDGLMTIFFLLIGLELEREIYHGELSNFKDALLPIFGALGGILVPAGIYLFFNYGSSTQVGAGIPMATDIAFALGILSLLGNRVPMGLKIFLTALAVIDDLGAILIVALFYTKTILWNNLLIALAIFGVLLLLSKKRVTSLRVYLVGGILMWYFMLNSGVHATITGVLLAFAIPYKDGSKTSTSYKLQHFLHIPVAFIVLPIFALANTSIVLGSSINNIFSENYSLGISLGLLAGKPMGILLFVFLAVSIGICTLPKDLSWKSITGVGFLGGIGFTMSIFITLLAFEEQELINKAKLVILITSLVAGLIGYFSLKKILIKPEGKKELIHQ